MKQEEVKIIKLQLEGAPEAFRSLDGQSKICNWLYNRLLEKANTLKQEYIRSQDREIAKILYTERGLRNQIPLLKKEHSFLKSVHSSPLKNAGLRLSQAIQAYQKSKKGLRASEEIGWPKFRSWQAKWFSVFYDEPNKGFKVLGNQLTLSLGGRISLKFTLKDHILLKNQRIRNLRIVKQASCYYAIFTILIQLPDTQPIKRIIAFDPNHKNMCHGVDINGKSIEVKAPRWLKIYDKRIDELKSKRDRCLKKSQKQVVTDAEGNPLKERFIPSKRWQKYQKTLERVRHKRQEQTKTYVYTLAHEICKQYDVIGIGNYTPQGEGITKPMRRAMNNRSLIGRFKQTLKWVATKSGKLFIEYDEKGTTRTCSHCHHILLEGLDPSIRKWNCPKCSIVHLRDENSALNGLLKILQDLYKKWETLVFQVPCSGLFHIIERWAWRVLPSGVQKALRGHDSELSQAPRNEIGNLIVSIHKLAH